MSAEDNKEAAKRGYAAFAAGDAEAAMQDISDAIEWVVGGDNALTGSYVGKEAVGGFWLQLVGKGFQNQPREFLADGDKVVVLATNTLSGETADSADVLSYDGSGKLVKFETYGDTEVIDREFPK